jgi:hypothetical protein
VDTSNVKVCGWCSYHCAIQWLYISEFSLYCVEFTYIFVFTKYTDTYLYMHVGLCAVNFNNIIIYMYTYASQVAAVYHVQILLVS